MQEGLTDALAVGNLFSSGSDENMKNALAVGRLFESSDEKTAHIGNGINVIYIYEEELPVHNV